ncbi:hypothetical protein FQN54_004311 [Arachnomyces sp. PD_36]|nr:hypothetical protein FQN54_004311 [Arachnomyces sp. PD_36]
MSTEEEDGQERGQKSLSSSSSPGLSSPPNVSGSEGVAVGSAVGGGVGVRGGGDDGDGEGGDGVVSRPDSPTRSTNNNTNGRRKRRSTAATSTGDSNNNNGEERQEGESRPRRSRATGSPTSHNEPQLIKPKRTRARREKEKELKETKEVKTRKPRSSTASNTNNSNNNTTDNNNNNSTTAAASRKKPKLEHSPEVKPESSTSTSARQSKITDLVQPQPQLQPHPPQPQKFPQNGNNEAIPNSKHQPYSYNPPPPPPRTSGQNYDPIRSTIDNASPAPPGPSSAPTNAPSHNPFSPPPNHNATPPQTTPFRASASPAISSIIDPPVPQQQPSYPQITKTSPMDVRSAMSSPSTLQKGLPSSSTPPMNPTVRPSSVQPSQPTQIQLQPAQPAQPAQPSQPQQPPTQKQLPVAMDIDTDEAKAAPASTIAKPPPPAKKGTAQSNGASSKPPSPKPSRPKEAPPPLPSGSGLLTGALFGVNDSDSSQSGSSKAAPNIVLHIPLRGQNNQVINFARMAEEQYGFAALHPRLAAQRERLARVAAASAQLERNEKGAKGLSAGDTEDDLSVDVSDMDGDIAMTGMGGGDKDDTEGLGLTADGKRQRVRRKKIEGYDREDPFIDDSEMAWQEHAAASKDGFFVYSGPLVPEGEKVSIEKVNPPKRRSRKPAATSNPASNTAARSRAPAASAATSSNAQASTSADASKSTTTAAKTGGAAGGARSGTTTTARKPRVTKASKAQMEKEKADRERAAMEMSSGGGLGAGSTMTKPRVAGTS